MRGTHKSLNTHSHTHTHTHTFLRPKMRTALNMPGVRVTCSHSFIPTLKDVPVWQKRFAYEISLHSSPKGKEELFLCCRSIIFDKKVATSMKRPQLLRLLYLPPDLTLKNSAWCSLCVGVFCRSQYKRAIICL